MVVNDVLRNLPLLRRVFSRKGWREGDAFAAVPNQGFNFLCDVNWMRCACDSNRPRYVAKECTWKLFRN